MISNEADIRTREEINMEYTKQLCTGDVQPAFFMEVADAMEDDWFQATIDDWDTELTTNKPVQQHKFICEFTEAYILQRDVNHRYQQPTRLRAIGYNNKFRTHFFPYIQADMLNYVEAEPIKTETFTEIPSL